jgi:hypothetical protein
VERDWDGGTQRRRRSRDEQRRDGLEAAKKSSAFKKGGPRIKASRAK